MKRLPWLCVALMVAACGDKEPVGVDTEEDSAAEEIDLDGDGVAAPQDCDDQDPLVFPGAEERCDDMDEDCDGQVDEQPIDPGDWFLDQDGDGYGDPASLVRVCTAPPDRIPQGGDCNDERADINPEAPEVCDSGSLDEDCDGLINDFDDSVDLESASDWFIDADGDGFGALGSVPTRACADPSGQDERWFAEALDCNDGDPSVHPDAVELCDGVDNDCDASTGERDLVAFVGDDGSVSDLSAELAQGTASQPYRLSLAAPGTLSVCEGTWYVAIDAQADLRVQGAGQDLTEFNGGGVDTVLSVTGSGLVVTVEDLTLADGQGTHTWNGQFLTGGVVFCEGQSTLDLDATRVRGGVATVGAGVASNGCTLNLTDSEVRSNTASYYGGGVAALSGPALLTRTVVTSNLSAGNGGGLFVYAGNGRAGSLGMVNSVVQYNQAQEGAGAVVEGNTELRCTGSTSVVAGFSDNIASSSGGGVYLRGNATLVSTICDWADSRGGHDNSPDDVAPMQAYYGDDASFNCTSQRCQ